VERPELKVVGPERERTRGVAAAALGAAVLAAGTIATLSGADAARRPFDPAPLAESALERALAGSDPGATDEAQRALRERLRRTPLDGATRTIAASLSAEVATTDAQRAAAASQAYAAARLTPADVGVARGAARLLARCGRTDLALRQIAQLFAYAPPVAAGALADIEPFVDGDRILEGLPPDPAAWLAWSERLRSAGRAGEADARLALLLERWPHDLAALTVAASSAASRNRLDELARLVPPAIALPQTTEAASLHAYRARSRAAAGDAAGARADAALAVALSHGSPWVMTLAGDALVDREPGVARDYWTRALYGLLARQESRGAAIWVRYRLARLDDREGRAGDALRAWRGILDERPDDGEAKRRVAELTGGQVLN
jgi:tetratricopeptide (TPR) repeat protein